MDRNQREAANSVDRMLLENVLAILIHEVGNGAISLQGATDIYQSIARDLRIPVAPEELSAVGNQFQAAEKSYLALGR
ncbi:hypothetical protein [Collimonas sp.]|jgi:hypothetical protein|uniref:hypothetical protein n=1 Tax=Collimonas sp. TaxID=1963772 RepID=UPI002BD5EDDB|nr:hypothetical protein [Collimonas sp.]HWX00099.1 hypothetical protein [Collimonas sp.]